MTAPLELSPFDRLLGLQLEQCSGDGVTGTVPLREELLQPHGLAHGGVLAAIAETLASEGTNAGVEELGMIGLGAANATTFLRPMRGSRIDASATPRHRGRTTWVWDIECSDDRGRVCSVSRVNVSVQPGRRRR